MKLRNKMTGEIVEAYKEEPIDLFFYLGTDEDGDELNRKTYGSLAELNEEWEDYIPKEPLIGDGLERKLVRDWAFTYAITTVWVQRVKDSCLIKLMDSDEGRRSIVIDSYATIADGQYTIDELCGEEEE